MKKSDKDWYQGVGLLAWAIVNAHDQPSMVQDTLKSLGITRENLKEAEVPEEDLALIYEDKLNGREK